MRRALVKAAALAHRGSRAYRRAPRREPRRPPAIARAGGWKLALAGGPARRRGARCPPRRCSRSNRPAPSGWRPSSTRRRPPSWRGGSARRWRGCRSRGWRRRSPGFPHLALGRPAAGRARVRIRSTGATRAGRSTPRLLDDDADLRATALRVVESCAATTASHRRALRYGLLAERGGKAGSGPRGRRSSSGTRPRSRCSPRWRRAAGPYAEASGDDRGDRAAPPRGRGAWIAELASRPELAASAAACAAAALGNPGSTTVSSTWMTCSAALARVAGDALTTITGITIEGDLAGEPPPGFASGPSADPDDPTTSRRILTSTSPGPALRAAFAPREIAAAPDVRAGRAPSPPGGRWIAPRCCACSAKGASRSARARRSSWRASASRSSTSRRLALGAVPCARRALEVSPPRIAEARQLERGA